MAAVAHHPFSALLLAPRLLMARYCISAGSHRSSALSRVMGRPGELAMHGLGKGVTYLVTVGLSSLGVMTSGHVSVLAARLGTLLAQGCSSSAQNASIKGTQFSTLHPPST
ncbi:hypothetical protein N657DRAFT_164199 [Parathielavia appendiculata]|uniref:Secreted protein n=1 Tax=Parathielavia appendiculata TaxID=2587402 RepID=A0AAN6YZV3_9PEZI|nr:hypothetical protein N657DRAFT_164199 [Parathielavia appendiculata]